MADTEKKEIKDINVESDDFKAGYRQGYIDGMDAMADKVIERLHNIGKEHTDDGK